MSGKTKNFENSSVPAVFCFLSFAQTSLHMEQEEKAQTRMELLMCCLSICYAPLPKSRNLARKAAQRNVDSPNSTFPFPFHGAATNHLAPLESALGGAQRLASFPPVCVCYVFWFNLRRIALVLCPRHGEVRGSRTFPTNRKSNQCKLKR